jgi:hypothetical protein
MKIPNPCFIALALSHLPLQALDFEREVRATFNQRCVSCHGPDKQRGDLRLDAKSFAFKGGSEGPVIVPGQSAKSALLARITSSDPDLRMPPKGERLSPAQVKAMAAWIDAGASWPENAQDRALASDPRLQHWAWKPIQRPAQGRSIDDFLQRELNSAGLQMNPPTDSRTLLRRLHFSITGLPPSPEQVADFTVAQKARVIDELLASPRFGEKWARHWLDVVRFAESDGFEMNRARANAWPYRDYVIEAFNADKPYNRFVREQLAGDALGADAATGFLVGGAKDRVGSKDPVLTANQRADELHDMVSTTAATFLGVTLNCARCHDHKFDPIPTTDYYGVLAAFQGVQHGERLWREKLADKAAPPLAQPSLRPAIGPGPNEENFVPQLARFLRFTITASSGSQPCIDELEVYNKGGANVARQARVKVSGTFEDGRHSKHRMEFINDGRYGNDRSWISKEPGRGWIEMEFTQPQELVRVIFSRDRSGSGGQRFKDRLVTGYRVEVSADRKQWKQVASEAGRSKTSIEGPQVYAGTFQTPGPTRRNHRGDPTQPREEVAPSALSRIGRPMTLAANSSEQQRRLALADWIVSSDNPLTARVIVNRLWHHYFGCGLVDTPSDFGFNGGRPSHPQLLDFLASELMQNGWSLKHIHRLILNSRAFAQGSQWKAEAATRDSQSRLLWRFPPRRLEAEALRDSMLSSSGLLDLKMGGPGFDLFEPNENYVKVYVTKAQYGPAEYRRMVYQSKPRTMLDDFFGAFDCPDAGQPQPKRTSSTTPLQALNLLNSRFALDQAAALAKRIETEVGKAPKAQIQRAFALLYQRAARADEMAACEPLLAAHGLPLLTRALYNSNEFIRLD